MPRHSPRKARFLADWFLARYWYCCAQRPLLRSAPDPIAACGVAAISAIATAAPTFVDGYADGFAAVAVAGAVVAVIALLATPTVRPGARPQLAED
jgi:hypothetical protein